MWACRGSNEWAWRNHGHRYGDRPQQGKLASGELQEPEMTPNGIKLKRVQQSEET